MTKNKDISRFTEDEARQLRRDSSKTDWARVNTMTREQIEAAADSDDADEELSVDWTQGVIGLPETKVALNMRVDRDVLEFFKRGGRGYQTRINAGLRAYKEAHSPK